MFTIPIKLPELVATAFTIQGAIASKVNELIDHLAKTYERFEALEQRIAVLEKGKKR